MQGVMRCGRSLMVTLLGADKTRARNESLADTERPSWLLTSRVIIEPPSQWCDVSVVQFWYGSRSKVPSSPTNHGPLSDQDRTPGSTQVFSHTDDERCRSICDLEWLQGPVTTSPPNVDVATHKGMMPSPQRLHTVHQRLRVGRRVQVWVASFTKLIKRKKVETAKPIMRIIRWRLRDQNGYKKAAALRGSQRCEIKSAWLTFCVQIFLVRS